MTDGPDRPAGIDLPAPDADGRLRLAARDAADMKVVSALIQDALLPVRDMQMLKAERRFVMALNRFRWERPAEIDPEDGAPVWRRTVSGLAVDGVRRVQVRGLDQADTNRMLNVLSLTVADGDPAAVLLTCAGGIDVRIETDSAAVSFEDLGTDWPTRWRPDHPDAPEDAGPPDGAAAG